MANRYPPRPRRKRDVVALSSLATLGGILALAPQMAPVQPGSSARFWYYACGVMLDPSVDETGLLRRSYAVVTEDGEFGCLRSYSHGTEAWSVPAREAMQDFDRVLADLAEASRRGTILIMSGARSREPEPVIFD